MSKSRMLLIILICLSACSQSNNGDILADIAITGGHLLLMDNDGTEIHDGILLIKDGEIIAVGPSTEWEGKYQASRRISAKGKAVLPGLINTHTHLAMTLLRGMADDLPLQAWLQEHIWPAEAAIMDSAAIYTGSQLAMMEMIQSGTTTFNDMYFFADVVAQVADEAGMRGIVGEGILSFPTPASPDGDAALDYHTEALAVKWKRASRGSVFLLLRILRMRPALICCKKHLSLL